MFLTKPKNRMAWAGALLLCAAVAAAGETKQKTAVAEPASANNPSLHQRFPRYTLRPGDSFDLNFQFSPEFNQTLVVQPDGFISLKEVGDAHVSGLTLPQVQELVEKKYSSILNKPIVSVTPKDLEKSFFIAMGQVARPGKYELRGPITVTEAIAIAGGLAPDRGKDSQVVLFRREGNTLAQGQVIDVKKLLKHRDLREDVYLHPGDLVYVPQNTWSKIHQIMPTPGVGMSVYPGSF
jgi:polysaccharide export outer membrane protein